jgi:uncharacterized protein (DUF1697 family)
MHSYIALLRAVNVGGTGKLAMTDLQAMCRDAGFVKVQTYIASGNVVFCSALAAHQVQVELENRLLSYAGKPVGVIIRTADEMAAVAKANPFPDAAPNRTVAIFLNSAPHQVALQQAVGLQGEEMRLGHREIYVHYGEGMGTSKLKIPAAKAGTARNMNTVKKLAELAAKL